jgi:iron-sulfur cluster repair protein YtfE (RIC family)
METTTSSVREALSRAHGALLKDLSQLENAVLPASGEGLAELRARLDATHKHITEHFRFEEQNGYMAFVREKEPRLERKIQHLGEEHHQLTQALETLIRGVRSATSLGTALREDVRRWIEHVREHETRENVLVLDAFNEDISAED